MTKATFLFIEAFDSKQTLFDEMVYMQDNLGYQQNSFVPGEYAFLYKNTFPSLLKDLFSFACGDDVLLSLAHVAAWYAKEAICIKRLESCAAFLPCPTMNQAEKEKLSSQLISLGLPRPILTSNSFLWNNDTIISMQNKISPFIHQSCKAKIHLSLHNQLSQNRGYTQTGHYIEKIQIAKIQCCSADCLEEKAFLSTLQKISI